jgi:hypothetical protein
LPAAGSVRTIVAQRHCFWQTRRGRGTAVGKRLTHQSPAHRGAKRAKEQSAKARGQTAALPSGGLDHNHKIGCAMNWTATARRSGASTANVPPASASTVRPLPWASSVRTCATGARLPTSTRSSTCSSTPACPRSHPGTPLATTGDARTEALNLCRPAPVCLDDSGRGMVWSRHRSKLATRQRLRN